MLSVGRRSHVCSSLIVHLSPHTDPVPHDLADFSAYPTWSLEKSAKSSFFSAPLDLPPGIRIVLVANTAWNLWHFRGALIRLLASHGHEVVCIAPEDEYAGRLTALGARVRYVPLRRFSRKSLSPWSNVGTLLELIVLLRRERPGCAVFYTIKPNIFGALAARFLRLPAIVTVEGVGYAGTARSALRWLAFRLYRLAFRSVRRIVFLNADDRREFQRAGALPPGRHRVIKGTGIDTEYFNGPERPVTGAPTFLFVGRLLSDKGIREFVEAARSVRNALPQARFQILGRPDAGNPASIDPGELLRWARAGAIEYLGYDDDVRPYIAAADAVVLPSYREGMPRALLEGMAMGKAIITTTSIGCRETVDEGVNGFLVPAENPQALAEALLRFAALSPAQRRAMGQVGRQKAVREFSNAVVLPQFIKVLREAMVGKGL